MNRSRLDLLAHILEERAWPSDVFFAMGAVCEGGRSWRPLNPHQERAGFSNAVGERTPRKVGVRDTLVGISGLALVSFVPELLTKGLCAQNIYPESLANEVLDLTPDVGWDLYHPLHALRRTFKLNQILPSQAAAVICGMLSETPQPLTVLWKNALLKENPQ